MKTNKPLEKGSASFEYDIFLLKQSSLGNVNAKQVLVNKYTYLYERVVDFLDNDPKLLFAGSTGLNKAIDCCTRESNMDFYFLANFYIIEEIIKKLKEGDNNQAIDVLREIRLEFLTNVINSNDVDLIIDNGIKKLQVIKFCLVLNKIKHSKS